MGRTSYMQISECVYSRVLRASINLPTAPVNAKTYLLTFAVIMMEILM